MTGERSDFENEVRSLVARVLAGVIDGPTTATEAQDASEDTSAALDPGGRIAIGSDHGGFDLKEILKGKLTDAGWLVEDCGTKSTDACDYPVFAHAVARQVAKGTCVAGIMIDGAGIGSAMAANKVPGVRAAACYDLSTARNSREHNRANLLTLGAGLTGAGLAWQIVQEWLATPWGRGRHHKRVTLINEIESTYIRSEA
ncbi:MAG: ribose 5-phosphate isomerase B [Acidimicrobiales bacterium]